jgi:hypothetical protein
MFLDRCSKARRVANRMEANRSRNQVIPVRTVRATSDVLCLPSTTGGFDAISRTISKSYGFTSMKTIEKSLFHLPSRPSSLCLGIVQTGLVVVLASQYKS